ncbi:unnamed protein product [Gulo gulo]|uniref:Uncharacterized protein n=1 Tax=Gulo gulo TaxID=48420 RepID=A0A9X9M914_GULGU|nr:unnamed protein product [Gulo gulo]
MRSDRKGSFNPICILSPRITVRNELSGAPGWLISEHRKFLKFFTS